MKAKFMRLKYLGAVIATLLVLLAMPVLASGQAKAPDQTDQQILQNVNKVLADHPSFKDVKASVDDRIVTLQGTVDGYNNKVRVHDKIKDVDKVEGVRNLVNVNTERVPDDQLRAQLADKLRYDRIDQGLTFNNLTLDVNNGHVTIGGTVRSDVDRASALSIVQNAKGVTGVTDNIQVAPASFSDDDLRIRIARAIYGDPSLQKYAMDPQAPIRIVVVNGHVTLYGVVDNQMDKQVAETRAKSVSGAFSVDDKLAVASNTVK